MKSFDNNYKLLYFIIKNLIVSWIREIYTIKEIVLTDNFNSILIF